MSLAASSCFSWRSPITSRRNRARRSGVWVVAGLTAALLLALSAPAASAASAVAGAAGAPNAKRGAPPDSARHFPSPLSVMLRSAIVPGWGQVVNHKLIKAVLVVGGEGLLISKALDEYH